MAADHSIAMPDEAVEGRILDYLARELAVSDAALGRDVDLLTGGLLDSMGVLRLATFVSEEFGIEIQPADFVIENFRSVSAIACYISRVRSRTGGPDGPARS